ncbi:hypothetical protein [Altererythrobacter sp. ZODW24]|uniref:hypothetical protein n=1 Tax=Altererythrobacter sp. ZODW24 TaxID=2185142 RepID=UPI000DF745B9|nr:hypothetical protein [Altererythrobacter sp. ZODW24]
MTELARTPANLRRLFKRVDLAPIPTDEVLGRSLEMWRSQRGDKLAPHENDILLNLTSELRSHSMIAEALPEEGRDFALGAIGSKAEAMLGGSETRLTRIAERRIAARLRHLFYLAITRGEAVDVQFFDRGKSYEAFAAPVASDSGVPALLCTFRSDEWRAGRC